jgi:predicted nucleic acid-binding protein
VSEGRRRPRGRLARETLLSSVVVDASIAVQWSSDEAGSQSARRLIIANTMLVAPDIMPIEAANAWWNKVRRGDMTAPDAEQAVANLLRLDVELVATLSLLARAMRLAIELRHPVYDCLYLALTTTRGAKLATADERLRRAAEQVGVQLWRG